LFVTHILSNLNLVFDMPLLSYYKPRGLPPTAHDRTGWWKARHHNRLVGIFWQGFTHGSELKTLCPSWFMSRGYGYLAGSLALERYELPAQSRGQKDGAHRGAWGPHEEIRFDQTLWDKSIFLQHALFITGRSELPCRGMGPAAHDTGRIHSGVHYCREERWGRYCDRSTTSTLCGILEKRLPRPASSVWSGAHYLG